MCATRMHADEVETDAALVRRLLVGQFPQWADLRIELVVSYGTDHDIYRLGEYLAARLPRIGWATKQAAREAEWLPRLAPHLPLAVPVQLAMGHPAEGYPYEWSIYEWLPGENANGTLGDLSQAAVDLAAFVTALRRIDTTGAFPRAPHSRGGPLAESDEQVRRSIAQLGDRIDGAATLRSWQESLDARCGTVRRSGCTATCCRATCSSSTAACRPSSTSVASTWAIPRVTCNRRGTSSPAGVACGFAPNSVSTRPPGCGAAVGRSARPCPRWRTTGTQTPGWSGRPRMRWRKS
jgi:hypothetical protein